MQHPEFAGRPDLSLLNAQEPAGIGGEHGTSVASVIGAPVNGIGVVGIYPQAVLRSWDAALGEGTRLESSGHRRGHPRRRALREGRHQPQPRRRPRPADRARRLRGGRDRLARRRRVRERRHARQPDRLPGGAPARHHGRRNRPLRRRRRILEPLALRRRRSARRRHPRRQRARQELASLLGHELLVPARRRRGRLALDRPTGSRRRAGRGDPPPLRARHRSGRPRCRLRLRDAERPGGARAADADPRPVRAERRRRRGLPERRPQRPEGAAADDGDEAGGHGSTAAWTPGRTRATSSASGSPPAAG